MSDSRPNEFSPLYCRYNGVMCGQFFVRSMAAGWNEQAPSVTRLREFLAEIGVDEPMPTGKEGNEAEDADRAQELLVAVSEVSNEVADFVHLGIGLIDYHDASTSDDPEMRAIGHQIDALCERWDLPAIDPDRFPTDGDLPANLSSAGRYLAEVIDRLPPEEDTAFVALPFEAPFSEQFTTLYRPTLQAAGFRAIRAWGGLFGEDYLELVVRLIAKSGLLLAEASGGNLNVVYEAGVARGLGKPVIAIADEASADRLPSNVFHDLVIRYQRPPLPQSHPSVQVMPMMIDAYVGGLRDGHPVTPRVVYHATMRALQDMKSPPQD